MLRQPVVAVHLASASLSPVKGKMMELTLPLTTTMALLSLSKTLNSSSNSSPLISRFHRHFATTRPNQLLHHPLSRILVSVSCRRLNRFGPSYLPRSLGALEPVRCRLACVSNSAAFFASGGGGFRGNNGSGGDGGGGGGGREDGRTTPRAVAGGADDASVLSSDVIILDVGGMTCGGCAASVKRILESQPQVSSASVNLTTETAIIWPVTEAKVVSNWQTQLGEALAKHLTNCGFKSNLRDSRRENFFQIFERKMDEKHIQLKESGRGLLVSWALCTVCLIGHLSHFFGSKASWIHALHSTGFHMSLSLFTLLGPGRKLIIDGLKSLIRGAPNMNTLVGLGAISSFAVSSLAAFVPKLGWKTFFEEPVMLIAFVLLGRKLEQRAKLKATGDMTNLLSVLPSKARLIVNDALEGMSSTVEVPINSLSVGDQIIVLPGVSIGKSKCCGWLKL